MFFDPKRDRFYPNVVSAGELCYPKLTNLGAPRVITAPPGTPEDRLQVRVMQRSGRPRIRNS